jgi:hypothetical protein
MSEFVVQKKTQCRDCVSGMQKRYVLAESGPSVFGERLSDAPCNKGCTNGYIYEEVSLADALVELTDGDGE